MHRSRSENLPRREVPRRRRQPGARGGGWRATGRPDGLIVLLMVALLWACGRQGFAAEPAAPASRPAARETTGSAASSPVTSPSPPDGSIRFTARDAYRQALGRNKALMVSRVPPAVARAQVTVERGIFDRNLGVQVLHQDSVMPTDDTLVNQRILRTGYDTARLGLTKMTPAGTQWGVAWNNRRDRTNAADVNLNPAYSSDLVLTVTHPLSRNGGPAAVKARLKAAEAAEVAARERLRRDAEQTVAQVERAIVEVEATRQDRHVRELVLQDAERLVSYHSSRKEAGLASQANILEAESVAQLRREDLLLAARAVREAQDGLRQLLSWADCDPEAEMVCVDTPYLKHNPELAKSPPAIDKLLDQAFETRPDYRAALKDLEAQNILLRYAANQRHPKVDLVATQQYNGLAGDLGPALGQVVDRDHGTWAVGVNVEVSLENHAARGNYKKNVLAKQQALLVIKQIEDAARKEVATTHRRVKTNQERVRIAQRAVELAVQKLKTEEGRFREGLLPNVELLRFQEDLASARSRLVRAHADLTVSWVDLETAIGVVLPRRGIQFDTSAQLLDVEAAP
ncbi:MAG: TolC family protein [Candidatus Riflebacteria bacterium]|nr:TolC family protein [Candidatus Riflebacteria bacterium]